MGKDERTRKRRRRGGGGHQAENNEEEEEEEEGEGDLEEEEEWLRLRRHSNHKHKLKLVLKLPRSYAATNTTATTTTTATNSSSSSIPTTSLAPRGGAGGAGGLLSDTLSSPNPRRRERRPDEREVHVTVGHSTAPAPPAPTARVFNDEDDDEDEDGESPPKKKKRNINVVVSTANANGSRTHPQEDGYIGSPPVRRVSSFKVEKQNQCLEVTDSLPGTSSGPESKTPMPEKKLIEFILDKLQKKDTYGVFSEPVDPEELPDYHEVIQNPMDFGTIRKKLVKGVYACLEELENDVFLVCTNAMHYNASDTIYHKQARAIQELAKKKFQMIRLNPEGIEAELRIFLKTKPGYSSKKTKKPGPGRPQFEPTGSDFSSGATLATAGDHTNWSNASLQDSLRTKRASTAERPGNISGHLDTSGKSFQASRSGDGLGPLMESKAEKSEELSASVPKAPAWRNGRRSLQLEENRRATYKPFNLLENGYDAIFSILDGDSKQLVPIGIRSEYAYTRSIARFAANAGSLTWKIAAQRIQRALPPNVPFGPGWVGDSEAHAHSLLLKQGKSTAVSTSSATLPIVLGENKVKSNTSNDTPMINGGHSKNLISECRSVSSTTQQSSMKRLVSNSAVCEPMNNHRSVCNDQSDEKKYGGLNASGNMKVNLPSHEVKQGPAKQGSLVAPSDDLSLSNTKFGSEVTQSRLLEMVSRNNTLVHGISMKQAEGSNTSTSIKMMHSETKTEVDTRFTRETSDASKRLCSPDESNPVATRPNTSLNNHQFRPEAFQASQATVGHGHPMQKPNSLGSLLPGKMLGVHHRGSNLSTNAPVFVNSSLTSIGPSIKRDDPTMQAWIQSQNVRLADADTAARNGMRVVPSLQIEQSEPQTRDYSAIARSMPKELQVDMRSQALSQFSRLHSQNSTKLSNSTPNPGPVVESLGPKSTTPYVQIPLGLESSKSHMHSWRGLPSQFLPEKEKVLNVSPSKPPDLNVELQKPNSPGRQSSGMLAESQQPDLALQL